MRLGAENETQEFKESLSQLDKGLKSLTAMLNRRGQGAVYFGVHDDGTIKGLDIGKKTLMDIRNRIKDLIEPQILAQITTLSDENGHNFIKVSAIGSDLPYSCDGRYFVRNVAADESVSNDLLRKMLASGDADLIKQQVSDRQDLTFKQLFTKLGANNIHTSDTKQFYNNYGLLNKDGLFNTLAYLLSDQNDFSIKVVRFAGNNKACISQRTEYGKQCLLTTVEQVLQYFKSVNVINISVSDGIRSESPLFHYEAFREAWINACLHNCWHEGIPPTVYIFDDRLEVVSYGGLPYGLTKDGFFNGTSLPVNRSLLTVFIITGLAEQSGHGVPIIVSNYGQEAFSFTDGLLKVTLKYSYEPEQVQQRKVRESRQTTLNANQLKVYNYLGEHQAATLQEVANELHLSLAGVKKIVNKLQDLNLIERQGSKRSGLWLQVDFKSRL